MRLFLNQVSKIARLPYGGVRLWCIKAVEREKWQSFENNGLENNNNWKKGKNGMI